MQVNIIQKHAALDPEQGIHTLTGSHHGPLAILTGHAFDKDILLDHDGLVHGAVLQNRDLTVALALCRPDSRRKVVELHAANLRHSFRIVCIVGGCHIRSHHRIALKLHTGAVGHGPPALEDLLIIGSGHIDLAHDLTDDALDLMGFFPIHQRQLHHSGSLRLIAVQAAGFRLNRIVREGCVTHTDNAAVQVIEICCFAHGHIRIVPNGAFVDDGTEVMRQVFVQG